MGDSTSLVNLGEVSKPASVLIEKISDAIGGIFKPYQIIRVARAEAEAEIIRAEAQIKIEGIHKRALHRFLQEEARKQANIEEITRKALPSVGQEAKPQELEIDWITNFFDKCRLISDEQMQGLWSRVLAGEANNPGAFSRRTIDLLASLDKQDADLFTALCTFCWMLGYPSPLVFHEKDAICNTAGINFGTLQHLESIGLVQFGFVGGFARLNLPKTFTISYYGRPLQLRWSADKDNQLDIGKVLLTKTGRELAPICGAKANPDVFEYVKAKYAGMGLIQPEEGVDPAAEKVPPSDKPPSEVVG